MAKGTRKRTEGKPAQLTGRFLLEVSQIGRACSERAIRDELDPQSDVVKMIGRICTLAIRAREQNHDEAFAPGLRIIEQVADELRCLLPPYVRKGVKSHVRPETRDRHKEVVGRLSTVEPVLVADNALRKVSKCPEQWSDKMTVSAIRGDLGELVRPRATDKLILDAVSCYRLPQLSRKGRPPKRAGGYATQEQRAQAAFSLVETGPVENASKRLKRARRLERDRQEQREQFDRR
jgi:hypothetical protein